MPGALDGIGPLIGEAVDRGDKRRGGVATVASIDRPYLLIAW